MSELSINGLGRRTVELKLPKIPETLVHRSSFRSEKQGLLPAGVRSLSYSTIEVSERFKDPEVLISLPSTSSPSMSVLTPERIDRWEVFWAEVYLILTVTALGMHITRVDPHVEVFSNMVFNGVYTWTYAACLCKYAVMSYPPSWPFRSAVALFTTGYAAFLLKYLAAYNHMDLPWFYVAGALLFTSGSLTMFFATRPTPTLPPEEYSSYSEIHTGSAIFLLGSLVFTADSSAYVLKSVSLLSISFELEQLALILFVLGRIFFLRGVVTPNSDMLYRKAKWMVLNPRKEEIVETHDVCAIV